MLLAATGLLGIGYEVLVVRVLSQVAENTVYTFAILLAVYLVGTAIGAALVLATPQRSTATLLRALARRVPARHAQPRRGGAAEERAAARDWAEHELGALRRSACLRSLAFLPPTIVMGALFSHLVHARRGSGVSFGRAIGINTAGAAVAPFVCGVLLVPQRRREVRAAARRCGLSAARRRDARGSRRHSGSPSLRRRRSRRGRLRSTIVDVPEGGRLVSYTEGAMATVSVVEDAAGVATLHIDNRQQEGSSATTFADARQAWLPILLHPAPHRALFLGLGTGVTASSATADPTLEVDAVELLPEVIDASSYFAPRRRPRLHIMAGDARRFVRASREHYDVIVADNFHPARSGSGSLYTVEHFSAVQARLADDGLFCQWLPLHQLDLDTLRSIVRSFIAVYPHGYAILATNSLETPVIGLVARNGDERLRSAADPRAIGEATSRAAPRELGDRR